MSWETPEGLAFQEEIDKQSEKLSRLNDIDFLKTYLESLQMAIEAHEICSDNNALRVLDLALVIGARGFAEAWKERKGVVLD